MNLNRPHGFTLLEAIIALALLASAGMAMFAWINTNIITLTKVQDANARAETTRNILEYMDTVNPMLTPNGNIDLGNVHARWQAEPVTVPQDGSAYPTGLSLFRLALYKTRIEVSKDGTPWFELTAKQVGHKKTRELQLPL